MTVHGHSSGRHHKNHKNANTCCRLLLCRVSAPTDKILYITKIYIFYNHKRLQCILSSSHFSIKYTNDFSAGSIHKCVCTIQRHLVKWFCTDRTVKTHNCQYSVVGFSVTIRTCMLTHSSRSGHTVKDNLPVSWAPSFHFPSQLCLESLLGQSRTVLHRHVA